MNFDFLRGVKQLSSLYENCNNAEKLALTMPVQSVFTSRKSAELLAKFIYLAAHNEQMESMNFVDILNDPVFRDYIDDRNVMKDFHYIRKTGNRAVHTDDEETSNDAIDVLEALHFIVGETACMLGLINDYPAFDYNIESFPEAKYVDEQEIEQKAQKMFQDYMAEYNAQIERENYYKRNVDSLLEEFDSLCSQFAIVPGDVDLNEVIEFKAKPVNDHYIKPIQTHFAFLAVRALQKIRGTLPGVLEDREVEFSGELTIYGEDGYTTSNLLEFINGILYDLPSADGFKIVSKYYGPSIAPWFEANKEIRLEPSDDLTDFTKELGKIGQHEEFTYMIHEFQYNHGTGWTAKYENGEWSSEPYSTEIVDRDFGSDWWCWNLDLYASFDYEKYPDILEALHNTVREYIPEDQIEYCEGIWEDGDVGILCNSITWEPRKLRDVQDFLDKLNEILKPIMNECECNGEGSWYIKEPPFAVATWDWSEEGFKVKGICYE